MVLPLAALLGALALGAGPPKPAAGGAGLDHYLFDIATPIGQARSTWAALAYDRGHDELFAVYANQVHVFNAAAMESYAFGGDGDLGLVQRVALLEDGGMVLLSSVEGRPALLKADFRGERQGELKLSGLPATFAGFLPDKVVAQGGKLHLVQSGQMRVVVTNLDGKVEQAIDLAKLVLAESGGMQVGLSGFTVDDEGRYLFTMPLSFVAFVMTPQQELRKFGSRGSVPGKFNVAGAIACDEHGSVFVLDRLRAVVMIWNADLHFVREFGYRGDGPDNLIAPYDLAVGNGKVFVSQAGDRGVKVFQYQPVKDRGDGGGSD